MFKKLKLSESISQFDWVELSKITPIPENKEIYGNIETDRDYIESLTNEIMKKGLLHPIEVYKIGKQISAGNHRYTVAKEAGETHIPVIWQAGKRPKSKLKTMEAIISDNMRKPLSSVQKFNAVVALHDQRIKEFGSCNDKQLKHYCSQLQTTFDTFNKLRELKDNRQDLFDKIMNDENALSVTKAYSFMQQDAKRGPQLAAAPPLVNLITNTHIKKTVLSVQETAHKIYNVQTIVDDKRYKFVPTYSENFLSALIHHTFANVMATILVNDKNVECVAPKNNTPYDIKIPGFCWEPEIKVAKWNGKNLSNVSWLTNKAKSGYYFLIVTDLKVQRFFVAYGFIDDTLWKRAGANLTLSLEDVYKSGIKQFMGSISNPSKNEYQIWLDVPTI